MKFAMFSLVLIGCAGNGVAEPEHIKPLEMHSEVIYVGGKEVKTSCHKDIYKVADKSFEFTTCAMPTEFDNDLDDPIPYNVKKAFDPSIYIQQITSVERGQ